MKTILKNLTKDGVFVMGLALIALSLLVFVITDPTITRSTKDYNFSIFLINYIVSIIYFGVIWFKKIKAFYFEDFADNIEYGFLHLILCLISAYSLNREIPVFEQSKVWVQILLIIQGVVMIAMFFRNEFPRWVQVGLYGLLGVGFIFFVYLSLYLIPLYPIGFIAFLAFGISLHALIPMFILVTIFVFIIRSDNRSKANLAGFTGGVVVSLVVVSVFLIEWTDASKAINRASNRVLLEEKTELPAWVMVSQQMPKSAISEKILKSDIVYSAASDRRDWDFFDFPTRNFDEVRKHDPLVMIATFLYGRPALSEDDRIKVLEAMYDSRHYAQERLWSGDNLSTSQVVTNVRVYPNLRLAYTEKILTIRNHNVQSWNPSQEAIYTFHLPEGAVVTSLSLWINGKEEKAILTSKNKADSAYNTIVGYEVRDPSLVRWQEGNTVSVRVFPCTPREDRKFKIGITSLLTKNNDSLSYNNIWFDGPGSSHAEESVKLRFMDDVANVDLPSGFEKLKSNTYFYEGNYKSDWTFSLNCPALLDNHFSFDGKTYQIEEYKKAYTVLDAQNIYIDINSSWTRKEFDLILESCQNKDIYVFTDKIIKLNKENEDDVFNELKHLNFSVFPFYEIKTPQNSLVITKGTLASPNLSDLKDSEFSEKLQSYLKTDSAIKLYNLGGELSPYIKTLKELRAFVYDSGDIKYLASLIKEDKFVKNQEDSSTVVINEASIRITERDGTAPSNAPDHLMRLFSYNHVMYKTGKNYLSKDFFDQNIVDKAYKAYVVSPSTSLVVLETQEDYKRFDIKDQGTSLKNASMKSSGAVPEPHEWLLIALLVVFVLFIYIKNK